MEGFFPRLHRSSGHHGLDGLGSPLRLYPWKESRSPHFLPHLLFFPEKGCLSLQMRKAQALMCGDSKVEEQACGNDQQLPLHLVCSENIQKPTHCASVRIEFSHKMLISYLYQGFMLLQLM